MYQSSSPNTIYWRGYFYSIVCSCPFYQTLIDYRNMDLFGCSLFCSIDLCVCSYASTRLFWLQWPCNIVDIRYCDPSYFVLSQNCCSYSGSFMVPYKFLKCLFYICEICHWYFNNDCNLSAHQLAKGSKNYGTFTQ